jgi:hypothetical protein
MRSRLYLSVLALFSCLPLLAGASQQCPRGTSPVTVTGRVTSINVASNKQMGHICLTLTNSDGREVFDDCGALLSKIVSVDAATGTSVVYDTSLFDSLDAYRSAPHSAQVINVLETDADGVPCAITVQERTTELQWGSGIFAGATLDVVADGTISFCPTKNLNNFQLAGEGCVRKRHR